MENLTLREPATAETEQSLRTYFQTRDVQYLTEDAVFRDHSSGKEYRGRAEIGAMQHFLYHVAFDAATIVLNYIITEESAMVEGFFKGRHIGAFAGVLPTGREVNVPFCTTYTLHKGLIKEARMYMANDVLLAQLGVPAATASVKTPFVIRDIFYLKFGAFRQVKVLLDEAVRNKLLPEAVNVRVLTDFTGKAYRLIVEEGHTSLAAYESALAESMRSDAWQQWYALFKQYIESGEREILRQVM